MFEKTHKMLKSVLLFCYVFKQLPSNHKCNETPLRVKNHASGTESQISYM